MGERPLPGGETTSGPSERAKEAAREAFSPHTAAGSARDKQLRKALAAAHDPKLGEDRSVRLGDVLDALRNEPMSVQHRWVLEGAVDLLAREFGGVC